MHSKQLQCTVESFTVQQKALLYSRKLYRTVENFATQQKSQSCGRNWRKVPSVAGTREKSVLRQKLEKSSFYSRNWKKDSLAAEIGENLVCGRNWRKVPSVVETEDRHHVLPAVSVPLANETQFAQKPDQIELQLDRSQLPYSEYLGLVSLEAAQPSTIMVPQRQPTLTTKRPTYTTNILIFKH